MDMCNIFWGSDLYESIYDLHLIHFEKKSFQNDSINSLMQISVPDKHVQIFFKRLYHEFTIHRNFNRKISFELASIQFFQQINVL